jgi:hypothetical protein
MMHRERSLFNARNEEWGVIWHKRTMNQRERSFVKRTSNHPDRKLHKRTMNQPERLLFIVPIFGHEEALAEARARRELWEILY